LLRFIAFSNRINNIKKIKSGTPLVLDNVDRSWRLPMQKLMKMLEDVMVAITFAEAGEFDEANRIASNELPQEEKIAASAPATGR
jgi:hypothetical protein